MHLLTIVALVAFALWWFKPLRVFLVERTNRTVKVLLIAFPIYLVGHVAYNFLNGDGDAQTLITAGLVAVLVGLWLGLMWLGNWLEKRNPTQAQGPDLKTLQQFSKLPGVPKVPAMPSAVTNPDVQRAARAAVTNPGVQRAVREVARTAAQVDVHDAAGSIGRISGRWVGKMKKSMASAQTPSTEHR